MLSFLGLPPGNIKKIQRNIDVIVGIKIAGIVGIKIAGNVGIKIAEDNCLTFVANN